MDKQTTSSDSPEMKGWIKTVSDSSASSGENSAKPPHTALSPVDPVSEGKPGEKLGSGTIVEFLGEGGMARVYKTWNDDLEMHRAVKVMLPSEKKEVTDRFVTEARITARLSHPNIVSVFGVGEWKGCHFIEMEYIDGLPLDKFLTQRTSFPAYVSCAICILVARALCYAHVQKLTLYKNDYTGIIHRDLKPANIMLHKDGRLKLMDFGIARPLSTGLHTMEGNIVGTLPYLSPEQLNHDVVDQRADIYAVGAILYELLCGVKAFPDERLTDLINKKDRGTYVRFGDIPISVPAKVTEIVETCLKVKKEDRYANAEALADAFAVAYNQCTREQPETALKNFLDDPHHVPLTPGTKKKPPRTDSVPRAPAIPSPQPPRLPETDKSGSSHAMPRRRFIMIASSVVSLLIVAVSGVFIFSGGTGSPLRTIREQPAILDKKIPVPPPVPASGPDSALSMNTPMTSDAIESVIEPLSGKQNHALRDRTSNGPEDQNPMTDKKQRDAPKTEIDQYTIAVNAMKTGNLADAYDAIGRIDQLDSRKIDLQLDLVEKCLDTRDIVHARKLIVTINSDVARFHLMKGRVFYEEHDFEKALAEYENAIFASTGNTDTKSLKCDILFYQAACHEMIYTKSKIPEQRQKALRCWKKVQEFYTATPNHHRYQRATYKLQNL